MWTFLQLELTLDEVKWAIVAAKKLKIKHDVSTLCPSMTYAADHNQSITIIPRRHRLRIYVDGPDKYYRLRELKRALPDVVVKGIPSIQRAVINIKDKDDAKGKKGDKELLVEGYGLQKVMVTDG